ncbi:MAG: pentapeptide repeat-containing protein [Methanomicrobiales archaeon]|nr:pentapeptide repeat-containing protein [Methanomicrobiales archaeon]
MDSAASRALIEQGVEAWNTWREKNPQEDLDLTGAVLIQRDLRRINLDRVYAISPIFVGCIMAKASFNGAYFRDGDFNGADLGGLDFLNNYTGRCGLPVCKPSRIQFLGGEANLCGFPVISPNWSRLLIGCLYRVQPSWGEYPGCKFQEGKTSCRHELS